ncbi:MAG: hypothetical protein ACRC42_00050 [Mycoplasma sp.]
MEKNHNNYNNIPLFLEYTIISQEEQIINYYSNNIYFEENKYTYEQSDNSINYLEEESIYDKLDEKNKIWFEK